MPTQSNELLGIPTSTWILLVAALGGAFALRQQPFEDPRPAVPVTPLYRHAPSLDQDVEARIWEDPLAAVASARKSSESPEPASTNGGLETSGTMAVNAGNGRPSDGCDLPDKVNNDAGESDSHCIDALHNDLLLYGKANKHILILGAMVSGAPYADDSENRRRTRYAVLAGLYRAGFVPVNSEHLGYTHLSQFYPNSPHSHDIAVYEWFREDNDSANRAGPHVLLLWLDQDGFRDKPLKTFSRIVDRIAPSEKTTDDTDEGVQTSILGPADSDGLRTMALELAAADSASESLRPMTVYSERATASDHSLLDGVSNACSPENSSTSIGACFKRLDKRITLLRAVSSDEDVVRSLRRELKYRGISADDTALIMERDSFYGRHMGDYFGGCDTSWRSGFDSEPPEPNTPLPMCFTYLKGLDGLAPSPGGAKTDASQSSTPGARATTDASDGSTRQASDVATGPGQLDYLRRLTAQLVHREWDRLYPVNRKDGSREVYVRHRIKAIGVFGTDIYDKLLVLQALHTAFPRAILFTTDLDARLFDAENLSATQHLLVGASLGLSLRTPLQGGIQPFRDSYQSAAYFAALLAVHRFEADHACEVAEKPCGLGWTKHPHIFEIGRNEPYDLTAAANSTPCVSLDDTCDSITLLHESGFLGDPSRGIGLLLGLALATILTGFLGIALGSQWLLDVSGIRPAGPWAPSRRTRTVIAIVYGLAVLTPVVAWPALVGYLTHGAQRIPPPLFSGTMRWVGTVIQALCIATAFALIYRGQGKLDANSREIHARYQFALTISDLVSNRDAEIRALPRWERIKEWLWFPVRRLSANSGPMQSAFASEVEILIGRYLHRGIPLARFGRSSIATAMVVLVLLLLEYFLDISLIGEFTLRNLLANEGFTLIDVVSFFSVLVMLFLVFWVIDAMLLSRAFMLELASRKPAWPTRTIQNETARLALTDRQTATWLDLHLIEHRTASVTNLVWYPSLLIATMAASAMFVELGQLGIANNVLVLLTSALFVITAAMLLRGSAERWRSAICRDIEEEKLRHLAVQGASAGQLDCFIERVKDLNDGAFAPFSQQPLVRAVLVPALTYGATLSSQYFHIGS